jgi:nucleoside-diphosphate-sugar epimerase
MSHKSNLKIKVAFIGHSGLIGKKLLKVLLSHQAIEQVYLYGRRLPEQFNSQFTEKIHFTPFDFASLTPAEALENLKSCDVVLSTFGTTLKQAGSKENFIEIDRNWVRNFFYEAKKRGVKRAVILSSRGAHVNSPFFYLKQKGLLEAEIQSLEFDNVAILRPSLLLGVRADSRPLEDLAQKLITPIVELMKVFSYKKNHHLQSASFFKQKNQILELDILPIQSQEVAELLLKLVLQQEMIEKNQ